MTLAPLVLGGCLLPASVQIASLIADGVSLVTTDKTLSDHGLSAITNRDCAVWRAVNGEEVCREVEPGGGSFMVADAGSDTAIESEDLSPIVAPVTGLIDADDMSLVGPPKIEIAGLEPMDAPAEPVEPAAPAASAAPAVLPVLNDAAIVLKPPAAENTWSDKPSPAPAVVKTGGGTFFVIASFSRLQGAKRFARRHAALAVQVLAGTAKGKTVFRVATGPVGKSRRPAIRAKLADGGFDDAWALTLKAPNVVELAALN
jgi:hypothetical protein